MSNVVTVEPPSMLKVVKINLIRCISKVKSEKLCGTSSVPVTWFVSPFVEDVHL